MTSTGVFYQVTIDERWRGSFPSPEDALLWLACNKPYLNARSIVEVRAEGVYLVCGVDQINEKWKNRK